MGIFSSLFKSNKLKVAIDLSLIGTDMHSHLIPGIDDGAEKIEESVELIRAMYNYGYKKIITTPILHPIIIIILRPLFLRDLRN